VRKQHEYFKQQLLPTDAYKTSINGYKINIMTRDEKIQDLIDKMNDGAKACCLDICLTDKEIKHVHNKINI